MSTHSYIPGLRRRIGLSALSLLCGLLFALQLILPSAAFATASEHTTTPAFNAQGVLDLASVSVVRLVAEYTGTTNHTTLNCTGLGTVVGSWSPTSPSEKNTWILTDGTLINPNGQTCVPRMNGQLTKITMYANNAYTNTTFNLAQLGTPLQCQPVQGKAVCRDTAIETLTQPLSGAVLFSFHTDSSHLQPCSPVVAQQGAGLQLGIELEKRNATPGWPTSPVLLGANSQPQLYLTPRIVNSPAGSQSAAGTGTPSVGPQPSASGEPGMPIVNGDGNVVQMTLTGGGLLNGQVIQNLLSQQPEFGRPPQGSRVNTLNSTWDQGITQYERGEYIAAQATLKEIDTLNPQFQAALSFERKAAAQPSHGTNGTPAATNGSGSQSGTTTAGIPGILLLIGLVLGLLILILLLILVSMWARRRQELARFEAERIEAQRNADREALQIQRSQATVNLQHPATELPCPNCGTIVHTTAAFCRHCRCLLSPSESGLHLRATPPPSIAPQPQAHYMQPPFAPPSSISDLPPVEFSPSNGSMNSEATLPYNIQQLQGRNLSLAVGHLTDPGIKRKH